MDRQQAKLLAKLEGTFCGELAQELGAAGKQILVNSVAPGFIDTEMTEELPEEIRQGILSRVPLALHPE